MRGYVYILTGALAAIDPITSGKTRSLPDSPSRQAEFTPEMDLGVSQKNELPGSPPWQTECTLRSRT